MRFLSIAVLSGLFISTVCAHAIHDPRSFNLEGRANCPAGTEPSGNRCQDCSAGRFSTGGNSACRACPDGANSGRGDSSCTCQPGYFSSNGRTTDNPCTPCASGSVSGAGSRSCQQCEPNTYANGGTCSPCPDGYTSGPGASSCTPRCQAGSYYSSNQCRPCSAGSYSNAGATSCTSCPSDTFSRGNGASACEDCPSGSTSSPGSSSCKPINCSAGKYGVNGSCQTCPAGTYSGPNASSCSDCPAGSVSDSGSQSCTPCSGGYVPASNGKTCTRCDRNTYSNGDTCSPCPNGYTSNPGSSSCGPQPSRRAQPVMVADACAAGFQSCPVFSGRGGTECINPLTTLDSCGGCVAPEGEESSKYTGRDCSAIPHVDQVKCHRGKCEITSCRPGYEPSGNSCVGKSDHDGKNGTLHTRSAHGRLAARHHGSL